MSQVPSRPQWCGFSEWAIRSTCERHQVCLRCWRLVILWNPTTTRSLEETSNWLKPSDYTAPKKKGSEERLVLTIHPSDKCDLLTTWFLLNQKPKESKTDWIRNCLQRWMCLTSTRNHMLRLHRCSTDSSRVQNEFLRVDPAPRLSRLSAERHSTTQLSIKGSKNWKAQISNGRLPLGNKATTYSG